MDFKRAIAHLNNDLEHEQSMLRSDERAIDYHMEEIVRDQKRVADHKKNIQEILAELYLLREIRIKKK